MTDIILPDLPFKAGDEVVVLISGLGSTPLMELYILFNEVEKIFRREADPDLPALRRELLHVAGDGRRDPDGHEARCGAESLHRL